jgi:hypothetical protein
MKLWTMLAGLAVAGTIMAGDVYAQGGGGGGGGRGGFMRIMQWSDFTFTTAPKDSDDKVLTQAIYQAAVLKRLPEGADEDQAKTAADTRFIAIAKAAGVTDADEKTAISENQYYKGVVKSMAGRGRGGKKKKSET